MRLAPVALAIAMSASTAWADARSDAVATGQGLAKQGDYAGAIAAFRAAEAAAPHAEHDCLIALAELRRGALAEADDGFQRCRTRAAAMSPAWVVPAWVAKEEADLAKALEARAAAGTGGEPTPGEPGGDPPLGAPPVGPTSTVGPSIEPPPPPVRREPVDVPSAGARHPWALPTLATGGAVLVAGALVHVFAVRPARTELAAATSGPDYDALLGTFETRRNVTIGLYAAGTAVTIVGAVLAMRRHDPGPQLGASVSADAAVVTIGWSR